MESSSTYGMINQDWGVPQIFMPGRSALMRIRSGGRVLLGRVRLRVFELLAISLFGALIVSTMSATPAAAAQGSYPNPVLASFTGSLSGATVTLSVTEWNVAASGRGIVSNYYYRNSTTTAWTLACSNGTNVANSCTIPNLVAQQTYYFRFTAFTQCCSTTWGPDLSFTIPTLSSIATISAASIKGQSATLGTASATIGLESPGSISLSAALAAGSAVTTFTKTDGGATISKIAKFASGTTESSANFAAATAFSNGSTGTVTNGDFFIIQVTAADGTVNYSRVDATVLAAPPTLASASITGSAQVGVQLSAVAGAITGSGTSTTYQWQKAATSGGTYANISSATASTYTPVVGDTGAFIKVIITVANTGGSVSQTSSATSVVLPAAPTLASASITGSAQVGVQLSAVAGAITGSGTSTSYQWQKAATSGGTYTNISSATASTYTPVVGDTGAFIKVIITVANTGGSVSQTSAATTEVLPPTPPTLASASITGSAQVGVQLSAVAGAITGSGTSTSYQWQKAATTGGTYANISSATASTYTPVAGDADSFIQVIITVANTGGSVSQTSSATSVVLPAAPTLASASITGSAQVGVQLSAVAGAITGSGTSTSYQWQKSATSGGTYTNISTATASTYTPVAGDADSFIKVIITVANTGGSVSQTSSATSVVLPAAPTLASASITGTARVASALTAVSGATTGSGTSTTYQWQKAATSGGTFANISSAMSSTYTPVTGDAGSFIKVIVTVANSGGSMTQISSPTSVILIEQTITPTSTAPVSAIADETYTPTATAPGGTVLITLDGTSSGCVLNAGVVSFISAGICKINFNQSGDTSTSYAPAAPVQQSFSIGKITTTLSGFTIPNRIYGTSQLALTAPSVTPSIPGTFSYASGNTLVATVSGNSLSVTGVGSATITVTFTPTDSSKYATSQTSTSVTVGQAAQSISRTSSVPPSGVFGVPSYTPTASAPGGGVAITLDASASGCSLSQGAVTFNDEGTCILNFTQAGSSNYTSATPVQEVINVYKISCSVSGTFYVTSTTIPSTAGQNCAGTATIPQGITAVASSSFAPGSGATQTNRALTGVVFPASGFSAIGPGGFRNLGLASVTIPASVLTVGQRAFENNPLTDVTITGSGSGTSTYLGESVFNNLSPSFNLSTDIDLTFGSGKIEIGANFASSTTFSRIDFGTGVTSIGENAFRNIRISAGWVPLLPLSLTTIGKNAFSNNESLITVSFGSETSTSILSIDDTAFDAVHLTSVQYCGVSGTILSDYFQNHLPATTIWCNPLEPNAPLDLSATEGVGEVLLTWTPGVARNEPPTTSFLVEYSSNAGTTWNTLTYTPPNPSSVTLSDLTNDLPYRFRVAAINLFGSSTRSSSVEGIPRSQMYPTNTVVTRRSVGTRSGVAFTTQPQVTVIDVDSRTVVLGSYTVRARISSGSGGSLMGTTTAVTIRGVATFSGLGIRGVAGTSYVISYEVDTLTAGSESLTVTPGVATQLFVETNASGGQSGVNFTTQPRVSIKDAQGNTVTSATDTISLGITSGAGGTITGVTSQAASSGIASFAGLSMKGIAGRTYTLTYTATSLSSVAQNIILTPGVATDLAIIRPSAGATSGDVFTVQPQVLVLDSMGNTVTSAVGSVQVTLIGATGAVLGGSRFAVVEGGAATFVGLNLSGPGNANYTLSYSLSGVTTVTEVVPLAFGAAHHIKITRAAAGIYKGLAFGTQPEITIYDKTDNVISTLNGSATATVSAGGSLIGTTLVTFNSGVATFSNLGLSGVIGSTFLISFSHGSITSESQAVILRAGPPLIPSVGEAASTPNGFTFQVNNFTNLFRWDLRFSGGNSTTEVTMSPEGLVTVNGLAQGSSATVTLTTSRTGYSSESATVTGAALRPSLKAMFASISQTSTGFTVQITNFDAVYTWSTSASNGGVASLSSTGMITVTGLPAGTTSVVTVTTSRTNYAAVSEQIAGSSTGSGGVVPLDLTTNLATGKLVTSICDGATSPLETFTNVNDQRSSTKFLCFLRTDRANVSYIRNSSGLIFSGMDNSVVTGIQFTSGDANSARDPMVFSLFGCNADGSVCKTLIANGRTGLSSARNVAGSSQNFKNTTKFAAIKILFVSLRNTWTDAMQIAEVSLLGTFTPKSAVVPAFGTPTSKPWGYDVVISNFDGSLSWIGAAVGGAGVSIGSDGIAHVSGLRPGETTTVTISSSSFDRLTGISTVTGGALSAALTPILGSATATDDGFTAPITNFSALYSWSALVDTGTVAIIPVDTTTASLRVSGQPMNSSVSAKITTSRLGYADGISFIRSSTTVPGLTPLFGASIQGLRGFTVQISNYDSVYGWNVTTSTGSANISNTGLVTIDGLASGASAVVNVRTSRVGYFDMLGTTTGYAAIGSAVTPRFDLTHSNATGFTVQILNFDTSFAWSGVGTNGETVTVNASGLVTVTGVTEQRTSTAIVSASKSGYVTGSGQVSATAVPQQTQSLSGSDVSISIPVSSTTGLSDVTVKVDIPLDAAPASTMFTTSAVGTDAVDAGLRTITITASKDGNTITALQTPISITLPTSMMTSVPVYSPDGITLVEIPQLSSLSLPDGQLMGYFRFPDGSVVILSRTL